MQKVALNYLLLSLLRLLNRLCYGCFRVPLSVISGYEAAIYCTAMNFSLSHADTSKKYMG